MIRALLAPYRKAIAAFVVTFALVLLTGAADGISNGEVGAALATAATTTLGVYVVRNRPRPDRRG